MAIGVFANAFRSAPPHFHKLTYVAVVLATIALDDCIDVLVGHLDWPRDFWTIASLFVENTLFSHSLSTTKATARYSSNG